MRFADSRRLSSIRRALSQLLFLPAIWQRPSCGLRALSGTVTCMVNMFERFTQALSLPLED
jgi:hypothetical protein